MLSAPTVSDYDKLVSLLDSHNVVMVEGPSRVGKTYLINRLRRSLQTYGSYGIASVHTYSTFDSIAEPTTTVGKEGARSRDWRFETAKRWGLHVVDGCFFALDTIAQLKLSNSVTIFDRGYPSYMVYQGDRTRAELFQRMFKSVFGVVVLVSTGDWKSRGSQCGVSSDELDNWSKEASIIQARYEEALESMQIPWVKYQEV